VSLQVTGLNKPQVTLGAFVAFVLRVNANVAVQIIGSFETFTAAAAFVLTRWRRMLLLMLLVVLF
jgi:hypothetical protein